MKKSLNVTVDRRFIQKILSVGNEFDLQKDGIFDARSGIVNIWCSPDDKPTCWDKEITKGALKYPREYVGGLTWEWQEDESFTLEIEAHPYELKPEKMTPEQWESVMEWVEQKAWELIRFARMHEECLGTKCPLCDYVLPTDHLLNELIDHVVEAHEVSLDGVVLGRELTLVLSGETFALEKKTDLS